MGPEPLTDRLLFLALGALIALAFTAARDAYQARQSRRNRERRVLAALLMEIHVLRGLTNALIDGLEKEAAWLTEGQWRLKPLPVLPTTLYDLIRGEPPTHLVDHPTAMVDVIRIQTQAAFTNTVAAAQHVWKAPGSWSGQAGIIGSYNVSIRESADAVLEQLNRLEPVVREAGTKLGGLKTPGVPPEPA